jgi:hypothetical protein
MSEQANHISRRWRVTSFLLSSLLCTAIFMGGLAVPLHAGEGLQRRVSPQGSLDCFKQWSEASRFVRGERLADVGLVVRRIGEATGGKVMSTRLCRSELSGRGSEFVYLVVVRSDNGRLKQMVLDAKTLSIL